jgi:hypothetical protein
MIGMSQRRWRGARHSSRGVPLLRSCGARRVAAVLLVLALFTLPVPGGAHATGAWSTMTHHLVTPRYVNTATTAPCPGTSGHLSDALCIYVLAGDDGAATLDSVEISDPSIATPTWTEMTNPLLSPLYNPATTTGPCLGGGLTTDKQCIYVIGGNPTGNINDEIANVEMEDVSASTPSWSSTPPSLNQKRYDEAATTAPCPVSSGLATAEQCIYAVGGYSLSAGGPLSSVEFMDPGAVTPGWTQMTHSLPSVLYSLGVTTAPCPGTTGLAGAKQCLYAVSGSNGGGGVKSVEFEDPSQASPQWTSLADLQDARAGLVALTAPCPGTSGLASATLCVYAIGGLDPTTHASVEVLDPSTGSNPTWAFTDSLTTGRDSFGGATGPCTGGSLATAKQCMYAAGGETPLGAHPDSVEVYDPTAAPTRGLLSAVHAARDGTILKVSWRAPDTHGLAGFNVYVGGTRVNRRLIPVHRSARYTIRVHAAQRGSVTVRAVPTGESG